jgi:hypothetical protein
MAKLNRRQLKGIVKECLLEILTEGIAAPVIEESISLSETRSPRKRKQPQSSQSARKDPDFDRAVKESVQMLSSNPIFQDIFDDTARTTLQEHLNADPQRSTGGALSAGPLANAGNSIPVEVFDGAESFGGNSSKWAALAFADPSPSTGR